MTFELDNCGSGQGPGSSKTMSRISQALKIRAGIESRRTNGCGSTPSFYSMVSVMTMLYSKSNRPVASGLVGARTEGR